MTSSDARAAARKQLAEYWLRAFFVIYGYPGPGTITQERTIWHAIGGQIRTSRICSTSSAGTVAVTSPEIRQIVEEVYSGPLQLPDGWNQHQRQDFLETEAAKISYQVAELAAEMGAQVVGEWTRTRGQHPDYLTKVGLMNTARLQAMEVVLNKEFYEQIPTEDEDVMDLWGEQDQPLPDRSQVSWDQRWTCPLYRSEDIEALIAHLWPDPGHSAVFRIKAGYLLAARVEDGLTLPTGPADPLTGRLAQMVYRDLRDDGLPAQ